VAFLADVHGYGVDQFLHQQGVDTTTAGGKALFQMMGVFAEFERAMIRERVKSGLERAKAQGKTLGRPSIDPAKEEAILVESDGREGGDCEARPLARGRRRDGPAGQPRQPSRKSGKYIAAPPKQRQFVRVSANGVTASDRMTLRFRKPY
jgi:hypothetical protein